MKSKKTLLLNFTSLFFRGNHNYLLSVLCLFLFSCNAPISNETKDDQGETTSKETNTNEESGDYSAIENYFLKLPNDITISIDQRKKLLEAFHSGKKQISDEENTEAGINRLDNSKEYLSFFTSYSSGEGGGSDVQAELAIFKNGKNRMLVFSSKEKDIDAETSTVAFFKVEGDRLEKINPDFPVFKVKDFFDINKRSECNGEAKFKDFWCNLSKNNENVLILKANFDDSFECFGFEVADAKEVELKWTGNAFEGASDSQEMGSETVVCKEKGKRKDAGSDYETEEICTYRNILIKTTVVGDAGTCKFGCHSRTYYLISKGKEKKVNLEDIFKNKDKLLKIINEGLNAELKSQLKDNEDCFLVNRIVEKTFDDIKLSIARESFYFSVGDVISRHCYGPLGDEIYIEIPIKEMKAYL